MLIEFKINIMFRKNICWIDNVAHGLSEPLGQYIGTSVAEHQGYYTTVCVLKE